MKISKLIKQLKEVQENHGDILVQIWDEDAGLQGVSGVEFIEPLFEDILCVKPYSIVLGSKYARSKI